MRKVAAQPDHPILTISSDGQRLAISDFLKGTRPYPFGCGCAALRLLRLFAAGSTSGVEAMQVQV
jgi:hypothetical protein